MLLEDLVAALQAQVRGRMGCDGSFRRVPSPQPPESSTPLHCCCQPCSQADAGGASVPSNLLREAADGLKDKAEIQQALRQVCCPAASTHNGWSGRHGGAVIRRQPGAWCPCAPPPPDRSSTPSAPPPSRPQAQEEAEFKPSVARKLNEKIRCAALRLRRCNGAFFGGREGAAVGDCTRAGREGCVSHSTTATVCHHPASEATSPFPLMAADCYHPLTD